MLTPGTLVVCVHPGPWFPSHSDVEWPVKGIVYTVRDADTVGDIPAIRLAEIGTPYAWYAARAFRPLSDDDIAVFRKALAPVPKRVSVRDFEFQE